MKAWPNVALGNCSDDQVRVFVQALRMIEASHEAHRPELQARRGAVRRINHNFGCDAGDNMDEWLTEHGING